MGVSDSLKLIDNFEDALPLGVLDEIRLTLRYVLDEGYRDVVLEHGAILTVPSPTELQKAGEVADCRPHLLSLRIKQDNVAEQTFVTLPTHDTDLIDVQEGDRW